MRHNCEKVKISCPDGVVISGTFHGVNRSNIIAIIAPATGMVQRHYKRFAAYLQDNGISSITFDYRDMGESKLSPLNRSNATFLTWALSDLDSIIRWATGRSQVFIIGHSFGGQAFGILESSNKTLGLYAFGSGSGWYGFMPKKEQIKMRFFWSVFGPISTAIYGYLPLSLLQIGEDLPIGVYRQWKKWCAKRKYWFDDDELDLMRNFERVSVPIRVVNSEDDLWCSQEAVAEFVAFYKNAEVSTCTFRRQIVDGKQIHIGHSDYFKSKAEKILWGDVLKWIEAISNRQK